MTYISLFRTPPTQIQRKMHNIAEDSRRIDNNGLIVPKGLKQSIEPL